MYIFVFKVEQKDRGKMMFEDEIKALGDEGVVDEFEVGACNRNLSLPLPTKKGI